MMRFNPNGHRMAGASRTGPFHSLHGTFGPWILMARIPFRLPTIRRWTAARHGRPMAITFTFPVIAEEVSISGVYLSMKRPAKYLEIWSPLLRPHRWPGISVSPGMESKWFSLISILLPILKKLDLIRLQKRWLVSHFRSLKVLGSFCFQPHLQMVPGSLLFSKFLRKTFISPDPTGRIFAT